MDRPIVICAVERGWQASRLLSLDLTRRGFRVNVLVKGIVKRPVAEMITKHPNIKIASERNFLFRTVLLFKIVSAAAFDNLRCVVLEAKMVEGWLYFLSRLFKFPIFLNTEHGLKRGAELVAKEDFLRLLAHNVCI